MFWLARSYLKRILDVHELRRGFVEREGDTDDVEAKDRCLRAFFLDVQACGAKNAGPLASVDRFQRMTALCSRARANLDEDTKTLSTDHQVELALGPAP